MTHSIQARVEHGPPDAQPLPWSPALFHIILRFVVSLRSKDWDYKRHPSFEDFARGVMAKDAPDFVVEDEALRRRYPPRPLQGLTPYLTWQPPEQYERTMKDYRDSEARRARRRAA